MNMTTHCASILELQDAIMAALPEESRHLLYRYEEATSARHVDVEDLLIRAIAAHLPHRAEEIHGAYEHVIRGDADPTLKKCCKH
jgi:hypothetical protein